MSLSNTAEDIKFLQQKLSELTFHYALDSYKAPTLNAPSLVQEAIDVWEYASNDGGTERKVTHLIEEIKFNVFGNEIVDALLPQPIGDYLSLDLNNPPETLVKLKMLARHLDEYSYFEKIIEKLPNLMGTGERGRISRLAAELVTTLANIGMSNSHVFAMTKNFTVNKRASDAHHRKRLRDFLKTLFPISHNFNVCLKINFISDVEVGDHSDLFDIEFPEELPGEFAEYLLDHEVKNLEEGERLVVVNGIRTVDPHSALKLARERVARLFDVVRLFDHTVRHSLSASALIHQCCVPNVYQARFDRNIMHFVSRPYPSEGSDKVAALLQGIRLDRPDEVNRFFRAVDLHGVSVTGDILENQFLNMWICFETTARTRNSKSIIDDIVTNVVPIICLNYFGRLLNETCFQLEKATKAALAEAFGEVDPEGQKRREERLFELLTVEENRSTLMVLGAKMDRYPLLRYRLSRLAKMLGTPEARADAIDRHSKLVTWQLHRVYRTRNQIVHTGKTPSYSGPLLENCHDYFDQVFLTICEWVVGQNGLSSFDQCFEYGRLEYKNHLSKISDPGSTSHDILSLRSFL